MSGFRLDWNRGGYFFDDKALQSASPPWQQWIRILEQAKQGDFEETPRLLDVFLSTQNRLLRNVCFQLLGDAGSTEAILNAVAYLRTRFANAEPVGGDDALELSNALAIHGQLLFVPDILRLFEWDIWGPDSPIFAHHLSLMLEAKWGPIAECPSSDEEFALYTSHVLGRVDEISKSLDSEHTHVFRGHVSHVPEVARLLLGSFGTSHFEKASQSLMRRRFEASTGINCTSFYREGQFQPLAAAAVLEEFLSSADAAKFVPGRKYFFGRLVP